MQCFTTSFLRLIKGGELINTYRTKDIADEIGIHVNTVRLYEDIDFITKPERLPNGYRVYTDLQLKQCRLVRTAMKAEVLQNGLRAKAIEIVKLCAELHFDDALNSTYEYQKMIDREIENAEAAIVSVENALSHKPSSDKKNFKRKEVADKLRVTTETLRTWERSGLISIKRLENGYCVYSTDDIERLNIIRTLRCANYSLSSILRLINQLDRHSSKSVKEILNTPGENEDIVSVCDKLIVSLKNTKEDTNEMKRIIIYIKNIYTLQ